MQDTRKLENLHVALWLLKDLSWCSSWHWLGMLMVIPTLAVAVRICWDTRRTVADFIHNAAVCFWICANIIWMAGEFFWNDGTRGYAQVFFWMGMFLMAGYYGSVAGKEARRLLRGEAA